MSQRLSARPSSAWYLLWVACSNVVGYIFGRGEATHRFLYPRPMSFPALSISEAGLTWFNMVDECDRLLVVGTTLATYSAFRLVKLALEQHKPVLMLNIGPSRADGLVEKIEMPSTEVLMRTARLLGGVRLSQDPTLTKILSSGVVQPPDAGDDDRSARAAG